MNAEELGIIFFMLLFVLVGVVMLAISINNVVKYNKRKIYGIMLKLR